MHNFILESNKLFALNQSRYRRGHSCETAITNICDDIALMIDKRNNVILLLLDLSAAFDTINHKHLIQKLQNFYGIKGMALQSISSYLSNRRFQVCIKSSKSSVFQLEIGAPKVLSLDPCYSSSIPKT